MKTMINNSFLRIAVNALVVVGFALFLEYRLKAPISREKILMRAAERGDARVVQRLIVGGINTNSPDSSGSTPLMRAAGKGHPVIVDLLLSAGADPYKLNESFESALDFAEKKKGNSEVEMRLKSAGLKSRRRSPELRAAVHAKETLTVERLLKEGVDPNGLDQDGTSALMLAADRCDAGIARLLVEAKADLNARRRSDGVTALMIASYRGCLALVEILLANGADPRIVNVHGAGGIDLALGGGQNEVVQRFRQSGCATTAENARLREAVEAADAAAVQAALGSGADVNHRLPDGTTTLMIAAHHEEPALVALLLHAGADAKARRNDGATAIAIAKHQKAYEAAAVLEENAEKREPQ